MKVWFIVLAVGFIVWGLSMLVSVAAPFTVPVWAIGLWMLVDGILMLVDR